MHAATAQRLHERLLMELEAQGDPRVLGEGHVFDEYPYSDESSRGFCERYLRGEKPNSGWVEPPDSSLARARAAERSSALADSKKAGPTGLKWRRATQ